MTLELHIAIHGSVRARPHVLERFPPRSDCSASPSARLAGMVMGRHQIEPLA